MRSLLPLAFGVLLALAGSGCGSPDEEPAGVSGNSGTGGSAGGSGGAAGSGGTAGMGGAAGSGTTTVVFTAPSGMRAYENDTLTVQLVVTGDPGDGVELYKDGSVLVQLPPPYTYAWDTTNETETPHQLQAHVVRAGQVIATASVEVVVDRTAPQIVGHVPASAAKDVSIKAPVEVQFSEAINPATVTDQNAQLSVGGTLLARTASFSTDGATLMLAFDENPATFPASVSAHIGDNVEDLAGNRLSAPVDFDFTMPEFVVKQPVLYQPNFDIVRMDSNGRMYVLMRTTPPSVVLIDGASEQKLGTLPMESPKSPQLVLDGSGVPYFAMIDTSMGSIGRVFKWDGTSWNELAALPFSGVAQKLIDIVIDRPGIPTVAVYSTQDGTQVVRYIGGQWVTYGSTIAGSTTKLVVGVDAGNAPVVALLATNSCHAYRYQGSWQSMQLDVSCATGAFQIGGDGKGYLVSGGWAWSIAAGGAINIEGNVGYDVNSIAPLSTGVVVSNNHSSKPLSWLTRLPAANPSVPYLPADHQLPFPVDAILSDGTHLYPLAAGSLYELNGL